VFHLHLHTDALDTLLSHAATRAHTAAHGERAAAEPEAGAGPGIQAGGAGVVRVDRYGPRSLAAVRRWLTHGLPGSTVTVTPVIDCTQRIAVDAYEIPDRLRAQITERDHHCTFPWCGRQGRFDLDHLDPYRFDDPDRPGAGPPPQQTTTENLTRLCRFHHRVKTRTAWHCQRQPHGGLLWTSPLGRTYYVDENGTLPRP
jgi:hypothetical protein